MRNGYQQIGATQYDYMYEFRALRERGMLRIFDLISVKIGGKKELHNRRTYKQKEHKHIRK